MEQFADCFYFVNVISYASSDMHFRPCNSNPTIELPDLNADCLAYIFRRLDIRDLYAIACAHPPLKIAFTLFSRKFEYTVPNINASNTTHFFKCIGMQIKTLHVPIGEHSKSTSDVVAFFECIQQHCTNVRHLSIRKWSDLNLNRFAELLHRLESFQLEECDYNERAELSNRRFMINPWIVIQPAFYAMQTKIPKSTGFAELINISTLKLHKCRGLRAQHLLEFFQHNNKLTELTMFGLKDLQTRESDADFFTQICRFLPELQTISIDVNTTSDIQFIAELPKLRSLQLLDYSVYNDRVVDRLLRKLCELRHIEELDLYHCNLGLHTYRVISQFRGLHTFKLRKNFWVTDQHLQHSFNMMQSLRTMCCFDNILLSDNGVLSIVRMSPVLTQLDVSWCFQVTNRAIQDIVRVLSEEPYRPKLDILAGGRTKITESVVDVSAFSFSNELLCSKHSIRLIFCLVFVCAQNMSADDQKRCSLKFDPSMPITCIIQNSFCLNCAKRKI